eukprot:691802-Alexandrium_andersonii.AAC.1
MYFEAVRCGKMSVGSVVLVLMAVEQPQIVYVGNYIHIPVFQKIQKLVEVMFSVTIEKVVNVPVDIMDLEEKPV